MQQTQNTLSGIKRKLRPHQGWNDGQAGSGHTWAIDERICLRWKFGFSLGDKLQECLIDGGINLWQLITLQHLFIQ